MPDVTIVAAWMRADTGVGPAIASGSQTYSGSCADFPHAPTKSSSTIAVAVTCGIEPAFSSTSEDCSDPTAWKIRNIATMKPQSPMRLVTKAFLPADALASFENQNEMRKYEQAPTPSHPRNVTRKLFPSTSISIENAKRLRYTKNLGNFGSPCMYPIE